MFDQSVSNLGFSDHVMIYGFKVKRYPMKTNLLGRTKQVNESKLRKEMEDAMCALDLNDTSWELEIQEVEYKGEQRARDKHMPLQSMRVKEKDVPYGI